MSSFWSWAVAGVVAATVTGVVGAILLRGALWNVDNDTQADDDEDDFDSDVPPWKRRL